jgi:hypothetical protein
LRRRWAIPMQARDRDVDIPVRSRADPDALHERRRTTRLRLLSQ